MFSDVHAGRVLFFFFISFLASLTAAEVGDVDRDGRCVDDMARSFCIAGPDDDDNNPDVNNDGICDGTRSVSGRCMQAPNPVGDADGDGITDTDETGDADGDLIPDYLDRDTPANGFGDSDGDGIDDKVECGVLVLPCLNSDGDGALDYLDPDSDNDGIDDSEEGDHLAGNQPVVTPFDIDGDGEADFRDQDSDNDGRSDASEQPTTLDQDMDGIPDVYDFDDRDDTSAGGDSDNDGLSDRQECPQFPDNCPDSDQPADGKPDYLDNNLDTDDDGIPDNVEDLNVDGDNDPATMATDTDNDGDPDYRDLDSDNDSVLDRDERNEPFNSAARLDDDGDGIPDVVDPVDAAAGRNGGDSDMDGVADRLECAAWPDCPDTDGDGIFDYLDGDSSPPEPDLGEVATAVDGVGALWWLLLSLPLVLMAHKASAADAVIKPDLYVSAGFGRSQLEPDTSGSLYRLDSRGDWAYKIAAGWDINQYFSLDGYYGGLGSARLNPKGRVDYRVFGVSAIGNYWLLRGERLPGSLALTARVGLNTMSNASDGVRYSQKTPVQVALGLGLELYFDHNFSTRLEVESYDRDAALLSLSLVKRFGLQQQLVYALPPIGAPLPEAPKVEKRRIVIEPVVVDADGDGILDDEDLCLNTPPYSPEFSVDEHGCAPFQGVIEGVQFISGGDALTAIARQRVLELALMLQQPLKANDKMRLQIRAHTDSQGTVSYNRQLSQRRANAIAQILLANGIDASQLDARGMGETSPRADNATPEGRARNRRVEFILISQQEKR